MHHQVVDRHEYREKIGKNAHRVILAKHEIRQQQGAARYRHPPERQRHHHALVLARVVKLHEPATGKHQGAEVADQLPRRQMKMLQGLQDVREINMHGKDCVAGEWNILTAPR